MSTHDVAGFLLLMMPVGFLVKTLVFLALWVTLIRQDSGTRLGVWINRLFLATFCASFVITDLVYYFYIRAEADDVQSLWEWSLVTGTAVVPWGVSICGVMVAIWNQRLNRQVQQVTPDQDAREVSQNVREAGQNAREINQNNRDAEQSMRDRP